MTTILNNFPAGTRGTFVVKTDEQSTEVAKIGFATSLIHDRARLEGITILLHCEIRGLGWVMLWWPASEPRHSASDQILS